MSKRSTVEKVDELKIDKDSFVDQDWIEDYVELILKVCRDSGTAVDSVRMCESRRKGLHFYIAVTPPVDPATANRLQWLLGDDSLRVDFNRARIESGLLEWNKLFEVAGRRLRTIYLNPYKFGEKGS